MVAETSNPTSKAVNLGGRPKRWTLEVCDNLADQLNKWVLNEENLFIKQFCVEHDFLPSEFHELIKNSEKFSKAFNKAKMILENRLSLCALTGKHKEQYTKFLMMNLHGYVDRSESKVTNEGKVNINITSYSTNVSDTKLTDQSASDEIDITPTFSALEHSERADKEQGESK
jgi:hypothetical protein